MKDWNKMSINEHIEHLENKFKFDSSGTAKSVFELISAYKALIIRNSKYKPLPPKSPKNREIHISGKSRHKQD